MARVTTDLVYGLTGQTLELRVQQGRPTSATFKAFFDFGTDDDTVEFSGTATVDTPTTTVSASSGPAQADPQKLSLTATTGIVTTRKYLVSEGSKQEWVQPVEIVAGSYIRCRHPLKNNYTTAATFVSTTITAAVDDTWAGLRQKISDHMDPNPSFRMRWAITIGSATYLEYSYFDLIRSPTLYEVDLDDLDARAPGLLDSCPPQYAVEQGRPLIDTAWRAVKANLAAHSIDTDAFRNDEAVDELLILKALYILAAGGWKPLGYDTVSAYLADRERAFETFFQQHISVTIKSRMASGLLGTAGVVTAQPFWSK